MLAVTTAGNKGDVAAMGRAAARLEQSLEYLSMKAGDQGTVVGAIIVAELAQGGLEAARFAWRRAGAKARESRDAQTAWELAKCLWRHDNAAFFAAVPEVACSAALKSGIRAAAQQVRENTLQVVGRAYSSIALADLASRTGLSAEATKEEAVRRGWAVGGGFVRPAAASADASPGAAAPAVDVAALDRLTEYVCALERPSAAPDAVAVGEKALTAVAQARARGEQLA
ncbi:hypothetical protein FNF31_05015 [Cafeteria roenbergensis]|uniref:CSN8/PSMD8/EIF3K domain-containing protein n=1 Tax=Cafeteria roenbergensis TaxID=33653 RepID=A0A5A8CC03_CAFRO|nr:hypothetical protein FNF28_07230 [Cafeteria roenbergensis]KAA0159160.1 hypothetical protein FNF31_05015 [Cafeteria roenbergensis]